MTRTGATHLWLRRAASICSMTLGALGCSSGSAPPPAAAPEALPPAFNYVLLLDRSDGPQDKKGSACETLAGQARAIVEKVNARNDPRSILQAYASGTKEVLGVVSLLEPVRRSKLRAKPVRGGIEDSAEKSAKAIADWEGEARGIEAAWRSQAGKLEEACRAKAGPVAYSPLYATLRSGLEECRKVKDLPCQVTFITDLQETAEPVLCFALWGRNNGCGDAKSVKGEMPPPLDAKGIKIRICGLLASHDAQSRLTAAAVEKIKAGWRKIIADSADLTIDDGCGNLPYE